MEKAQCVERSGEAAEKTACWAQTGSLDRKPSLNCRTANVEPSKLLVPLIRGKPLGDPTPDKQNQRIERVTVLVLDGFGGHVVWDRHRERCGLQGLDNGLPRGFMHAGASLIGDTPFQQVVPNRRTGETFDNNGGLLERHPSPWQDA